ncbi:hypothetical protein ARMSODRAFT_168656 [Armillaria solidipes]|uniref:Uncharacterized protein n=1 Tax=Armillaria solidipes TaxID=1076256 RepID=A0A2H3C2P3_9AGAR|nr:hypothetical protein ARMSODRAFT_168656 [Armillaria solidipes]
MRMIARTPTNVLAQPSFRTPYPPRRTTEIPPGFMQRRNFEFPRGKVFVVGVDIDQLYLPAQGCPCIGLTLWSGFSCRSHLILLWRSSSHAL